VAVLPGAEPFSHDGDGIGILLCHGFTGSPQTVRPWAEACVRAGHTVRVPRLPGHGTHWRDLNATNWQHWYDEVDAAFTELRDATDVVFIGGISMGAALGLRLAELRGPEVAGLMLVNPAVRLPRHQLALIPWVSRVLPATRGIASDIKKPDTQELAYGLTPLRAARSMLEFWSVLNADLDKVDQPVVVFRSPQDHVVPASSTALVLARISSTDVTETLCEDSYHVATLDNDGPMIEKQSLAFVARIVNQTGGAR
jgi:carboxylesterase